jgi:hypothetical protein
MPNAKTSVAFNGLSTEQKANLIGIVQKNNPGITAAQAEIRLFEALEGLLTFQTESRTAVLDCWMVTMDKVLPALDDAKTGKDTSEAITAFHGALGEFKQAVVEYMGKISYEFPNLAGKAKSIEAQVLKPCPSDATDSGGIVLELADYSDAFGISIHSSIEAIEWEIVETRKENARKNHKTHKADNFAFIVSPTFTEAVRGISAANANGSSRDFTPDEFDTQAIHKPKHHNLAHQLILKPSRESESVGKLLKFGGSNAAFVLLYVTELITRVADRSASDSMSPWATIDVGDVARKVLGEQRTKQGIQDARQRVWDAIRFADSAYIMGERRREYSVNGKVVDTRIAAKLFVIGSTERPADWTPRQFDEPPLRVTVGITPEFWQQVKTACLWEFLPFGEILGAIPLGKPGTAWARSIGLAWAYHSRRYAAQPDRYPTRQELLDEPISEIAPYYEVLQSPNPIRAVEYFEEAERLLIQLGFLAPLPSKREVMTLGGIRADIKSRKSWQKSWLEKDPLSDWKPGHRFTDSLLQVGENRPDPKVVKALTAKSRKKTAQKKKA